MKKLFADLQIFESNHFEAHQDWEVPIEGFFVVAAKRNLRSVADFTKEEAGEFALLVRQIRKGMKEVLGIEDVYLFQNEDSRHNFHLWMFPRHEWMEQFGRKIESVRPIILHARENMTNEDNLQQVQQAAEKLKRFLEN